MNKRLLEKSNAMKGSLRMGLSEAIFSAAFAGRKLQPVTGTSTAFKHWVSVKDFKRCVSCYTMQGKIWRIEEEADPQPPLHLHGRCKSDKMTTIQAGTATRKGIAGADWKLKNQRELPEEYISFEEAGSLGWKKGKNLARFAPNKMLTGGIYSNRNGHLPQADGRI